MSEIWVPGKGIVKIEDIPKELKPEKEQKLQPDIEPILTKIAEMLWNQGSFISEGHLNELVKSIRKSLHFKSVISIDKLIKCSIVKCIIMPTGNFYALTDQGKLRINLTVQPQKQIDEIKALDAMHKAMSILNAKDTNNSINEVKE